MGDDLVRRLDAAMGMRQGASLLPIVFATLGLGACALFPWACLCVASNPPALMVIYLAALSVLPIAMLVSAWQRQLRRHR